jgi:hypothetical protein
LALETESVDNSIGEIAAIILTAIRIAFGGSTFQAASFVMADDLRLGRAGSRIKASESVAVYFAGEPFRPD